MQHHVRHCPSGSIPLSSAGWRDWSGSTKRSGCWERPAPSTSSSTRHGPDLTCGQDGPSVETKLTRRSSRAVEKTAGTVRSRYMTGMAVWRSADAVRMRPRVLRHGADGYRECDCTDTRGGLFRPDTPPETILRAVRDDVNSSRTTSNDRGALGSGTRLASVP